MKKKIAALTLTAVMCLSLSACSKSIGTSNGGNNSKGGASETSYVSPWSEEGGGSMTFTGYNNNIELGSPDTPKKASDILKDYQFSERILYGEFTDETAGDHGDDFANTMSYTNFDGKYPAICNLENAEELTVLPYSVSMGPGCCSSILDEDSSHNWIQMYFRKKHTSNGKETNTSQYYVGAYEIKDNNKLVVYPLKNYETDDSDPTVKKIKYLLYSTPMEFDFKFDGINLVLSKDGKSVSLNSTLGYKNQVYFSNTANLSNGSEKIDDIDSIRLSSNNITLSIGEQNNSTAIAKFDKDGLFTMTYVRTKSDDTQEITTHQFVMFYQNQDGLTFTDGDKTYYYQSTDYNEPSDEKYLYTDLTQYVSEDDQSKSDKLSTEKMAEIAKKAQDLTDDLAKAFEDEGIKVTVNKTTGEMMLDANVIFGGDSSELTDEGKATLQKTMKAYTKTINNDKYKGFVSKTYVEGHTAPIEGSTYESGLPLSKERAEVVKAYCLSKECGVDSAYLPELEKTMVAVGYSNSRPVKDADGNVDLDASRRVSFRYMVNLDS